MTEYHKIPTVWQRDPANPKRLVEGAWATPEIGHLALTPWTWTEKVDGTNIRVIVKDGKVTFGGKTDSAQIPAKLVERLQQRFLGNPALLALGDVVLYGEGHGAGIQSSNKDVGFYRPDQDLILFDVFCGGLWLERHNVEDIAAKLDVPVVPIVGAGPLLDAIRDVRNGVASVIGCNKPMEGYVMRPAVELRDRRGERIIAKIKSKDFRS
jgi:hypothetical protein